MLEQGSGSASVNGAPCALLPPKLLSMKHEGWAGPGGEIATGDVRLPHEHCRLGTLVGSPCLVLVFLPHPAAADRP